MNRELAYTILDVFAERALEGNPLAVFHDARGLSAAEMQALARETNLSETTFVLPADDPATDAREGVRMRIFTTQEELRFAGHPTLGTASWLHLHHPALRGAAEVTLRLDVGAVPVRFESALARLGDGSVYGTMHQPDPAFGEEFHPTEVAAVLGLPAADLLPGYRPQAVSTGNPACLVALRSVEALERLAIPQREASAWLAERGLRWFYCIAPQATSDSATSDSATAETTTADSATSDTPTAHTWRTRMQWYDGEDPATGSAAGPCIAWLVLRGLAPSATNVTLHQGVEILRPSRLTVQATHAGGRVTAVLVGGRTVPVASGRFFLRA